MLPKCLNNLQEEVQQFNSNGGSVSIGQLELRKSKFYRADITDSSTSEGSSLVGALEVSVLDGNLKWVRMVMYCSDLLGSRLGPNQTVSYDAQTLRRNYGGICTDIPLGRSLKDAYDTLDQAFRSAISDPKWRPAPL